MTVLSEQEEQEFKQLIEDFEGDFDWINNRLTEYSVEFGVSKLKLLKTIEKNRRINAPNHYQDANYPPIGQFHIFENFQDFKNQLNGEKKFRCPACKGVSTHPYDCNTRINNCNWKSYGLFRGPFMFTFRENFAEKVQLDVIFTPLAFEKTEVVS